jgi:hypothetical protein
MKTFHKVWAAALVAVPLVAGTVTASEAANYRGSGYSYNNHAHGHSHYKKPWWKARKHYYGQRKYRFWRFGNDYRRHHHHHHHDYHHRYR